MVHQEGLGVMASRRGFVKTMASGLMGLGGVVLGQALGGAEVQGEVKAKHPLKSQKALLASLPSGKVVPLQAKPYLTLTPTVEGFSEAQWTNHLKLYEGYVKAWNLLATDTTEGAEVPLSVTWHPERERHVEKSFALNGVIFHELYFDALTSKQQLLTQGRSTPGVLTKRFVTARYGTFEQYMATLLKLAKTARGWVMTAWVPRTQTLETFILDTHHHGVPQGVVPLLVLDVYEHAYMIDFQTNRAAYLDVWVQSIRWDVIELRLTAWFEGKA